MPPINPYVTGDPVGNSPIFVGRDNILREVLKILRDPSQNAITLYGQRRVGKTSVLQFLQSRLPCEGEFQTIYFDLQDKTDWSLSRVLLGLANTICDRLNLSIPIPLTVIEDSFVEWLVGILGCLPADTTMVLLFDEFDVLADSKSGASAADFFLYLQKLLVLDPARLKFVLVLGRNFADLGAVALSTFKGILSRRISLLNKADTLKLVRLSEQDQTLDWHPKAAETVWRLTHGHPYLTQALCSQVWEAVYNEIPRDTPTVTPEMVEASVDAALDASRNTLEWLWSGFGPAEKVISSALSGAGNQVVGETQLEQLLRESGVRILIRELQNAPELLKSWDILEPVSGGYVFKVEILRRWIERYHSLKRTQDELDRIQPAADGLFQAAQALYAQGDLLRAEGLLKQTIGFNPNHLRANELLAEILIGLGRLDEARDLLERLFEVVPNTARPRLIQVYLDQAKVAPNDKTRLKLYERVLELDPSRPEALAGVEKIKQAEEDERELASDFLSGRQSLQRGKWDEAIELLQKVVTNRPSYFYEADTAAELLAQAVREREHPSPRWKIWLQQTLTWRLLGIGLLTLIGFFTFGIAQSAVSVGIINGVGPFGWLAPSTPTLKSTATLVTPPISTSSPTSTDTPTSTSTSTPMVGAIRPRDDGMEMVYIPAATFDMGFDEGDYYYEKPTHSVILDAFWIDKTEVTNAMFLKFLNSMKSKLSLPNSQEMYYQSKLIYYLPNDNGVWDRIIWNGKEYILKNDIYANHPVVNVTWYGADAYCTWAGSNLPTEAQWEYAARGTDERWFPWNNDGDCRKANLKGSNCDGYSETAPVGSFVEGINSGISPFNIFDMAGNVAEWVSDWYGDGYYNRPKFVNPVGPEHGTKKIVRGGSWASILSAARTSSRVLFDPADYSIYYGFRCASPK